MFRRITHIIFALLLLVATMGVTFSMHFCGGKLISTVINKEAKSCCDGSGGCCSNKTIRFELNHDFTFSAINEIPQIVEFSNYNPFLFLLTIESPISNIPNSIKPKESPPPLSMQTHLSLLQTYLC